MNLLTKWNPLGKSGDINLWQPATRWDPVREMEELMRGMQRTFANWPTKSEEAMTLAQWSPSVDIGENDKELSSKPNSPRSRKRTSR